MMFDTLRKMVGAARFARLIERRFRLADEAAAATATEPNDVMQRAYDDQLAETEGATSAEPRIAQLAAVRHTRPLHGA